MPLIHGKSKQAFEKNVKTEMEANPGKENRAQNLAIAYSVKRRAQHKKMAKGGMVPKEDMAREMDQEQFKEEAQGNHDLHPGVGSAPETENIDSEHLSHEAESADWSAAEPEESKYHEYADEEDMGRNMAHGGHVAIVIQPHHIAKSIMAKKMAQGGELSKDMNYLAENDSYPDEDLEEFDMLDPHVKKMAEGGSVNPYEQAGSDISKSISPESAKAMASAFKADGGQIDQDYEEYKAQKRKQVMDQIFAKLGK